LGIDVSKLIEGPQLQRIEASERRHINFADRAALRHTLGFKDFEELR
jgi:hypothetical protein